MNLLLMRHADAVTGGPDISRPLSDKGREQAAAMGRWLRKMRTEQFAMVASPYPRAYETAQIVSGFIAPGSLVADRRLAPGMEIETACAVVHELSIPDGGLFLVGHAPDLARLAAYLMGAGEECVALRKGAVARLEMARPGFGGSTLTRLLDPDAV